MNRQTSTVVLLASMMIFVVGVFLGFGGISAGGMDCGSVFGGSSDDFNVAHENVKASMGDGAYVNADACESSRSSRAPIAWALALAGGLVAGFAFFTRPSKYAEMSDDEILKKYGNE